MLEALPLVGFRFLFFFCFFLFAERVNFFKNHYRVIFVSKCNDFPIINIPMGLAMYCVVFIVLNALY